MSLTKDDLQALRVIIQEETSAIVQRETRAIVQEETQAIVQKEISRSENRILVVVENKYDQIINLLNEAYAPIESNATTAAKAVKDLPDLKSDVNYHGETLARHNKRIVALENDR